MNSTNRQSKETIARTIDAIKQGRFNGAIAICDEYLATDARSVPHLQLSSHALLHLGDLDAARERLKLAASIAPDYPAIYEDHGRPVAS